MSTLKSTTARIAHGPTAPSDVQATPPMKNAAHPSSASARVAARQTGTYETSVLVARTTGIRDDVGRLPMIDDYI
jgi:hypothetical protein